MYALVADIERYPEFLPWCSNAIVHTRSERALEASLEISRGPVRKSFRTRNTLHPRHRIELTLVAGPFEHLDGEWRFVSVSGGGCRISLRLDFAFSSRAIQAVLNPVFAEVADTLVDAFCRRARQRYGPAPVSDAP